MFQEKSRKIVKIFKYIGFGFIVIITTPISEMILLGYYIGVKRTNRKFTNDNAPRKFKNPLKYSSKKDKNSEYNKINETNI